MKRNSGIVANDFTWQAHTAHAWARSSNVPITVNRDPEGKAWVLVPASGTTRAAYAPLLRRPQTALTAFRQLALDRDAIVAFANEFGMLGVTVPGVHVERFATQGEPFDLWRDEILAIQKVFTYVETPFISTPRSIQKALDAPARNVILGKLVTERLATHTTPVMVDSPFRITHRPKNLLGAIWLQFALVLTGNGEDVPAARPCRECGRDFIPARSNQVFCTNNGSLCRATAGQRKKTEACQLRRAGTHPRDIAQQIGAPLESVKKWTRAIRPRR
jgi:hypothetical protein